MTAFSKILQGHHSGSDNIKDGHRAQFKPFGFWGVAGFILTDPGQWAYTNKGIVKCPVFKVIETGESIVASLNDEVTEIFSATNHVEVKRWLDNQILIAKRFEADVDAPLDWQPPVDWIKIDSFMASV